jgi:hypothetical protein
MAAYNLVTQEEHEAAIAGLREEFFGLLRAYAKEEDEWLDTTAALRTAQIKARSTLVEFARASTPGEQQDGRITYRKEGTKCLYSRASCISYAQRKQGLPALAA